MGRGYSSNRSATARPTNKTRRPRSVSAARLKEQLGAIHAKAKTKEEVAAAIAKLDDSDVESEFGVSEDEAERVNKPDVVAKYKVAGSIADGAVAHVVKLCKVGAVSVDLCRAGDSYVAEKLSTMYRKSKAEDGTKMMKGLSFPTTVCVNNVLANHSPTNEKDSSVLTNGDLVKVAVSVHIDGYATSAATSVVVGLQNAEVEAVPPNVANLMAAAHYALQGMIRLMSPGMLNQDVTDYIAHVGRVYGVEPVDGCTSNRTKRWILDGSQCVVGRRVLDRDPQINVADTTVEENEVWTLDVAYTDSSSYRMKHMDFDENILRRNTVTVQPRLAAAHALLDEVRAKYLCFPFTPTALENPIRARLGVTELRKLDMLDTFPVLGSGKGTYTVRASCTIAVTRKRINVLCGGPPDALPAAVQAAVTAQPTSEMEKLLQQSLFAPDHKKNRAAKVEGDAEGDADSSDEDSEEEDAGKQEQARKAPRRRPGKKAHRPE